MRAIFTRRSSDFVISLTFIVLINLQLGNIYIFINPSKAYDKNKFNLGL